MLFVPSGPLRGVDAIMPIFQAILSEFAKPVRSRCTSDTLGVITPIFYGVQKQQTTLRSRYRHVVVRNGKIVAQSFAAKIKPKR